MPKPTKREEAAHISRVHDEVFALSDRCYYCGETEQETGRRFWSKGYGAPSTHHMHETVSRAKTRGLPLAERFNVEICVRACPTCHIKHGHHGRVLND